MASAMPIQGIHALIADDEPLLAIALQDELEKAWPELHISNIVHNGDDAIKSLLKGTFDIAFLDIRMPGASGIEVAQYILEEWPVQVRAKQPPILVFVTAYEAFAVNAFELAALDYIVKPVTEKRIKLTVERLQNHFYTQRNTITLEDRSVNLGNLLTQQNTQRATITPKLNTIRSNVGSTVHVIPIASVILFQASDKYVEVHTKQQVVLIREPLKELLPQLDNSVFVQIHRSTIVNLSFVQSAIRSDNGRMNLNLQYIQIKPAVSRLYRHLFQGM